MAEVNSFDFLEKLEERNLLHIRDRIFGALDDRDMHNCSQVSKSWQRVVETIRLRRKEKLRMEMGEIGGAGHFWGDDKIISRGGVRNSTDEEDLKKVLRLLALGEKKINLKFWLHDNWEVAESGWTIQFKSANENSGDDGNFYLWISYRRGAKFKATKQEICPWTGEEFHRRELQSEKDGTRQRIKFEDNIRGGCFIRVNITLL
ncbi:unnamed protein product [Oikopleura dioica]|uniref:F-box domain-containing protein n=1 Tax=Oikopleura dioica TaxID=34765 RepID=E4XTF7_OIKDI|nr:unnamed protein product [Oikopleura dioica]CBY37299.1 unnamed protein product [Oikopleura dioica]